MSGTDARAPRRLAAIVVADVVRYSRMMEADEVGTLARLKELRAEVIDPAVEVHGGRIVKLMGDGLLAEFQSAVSAVQWALDVQAAIAARHDGPAGDADHDRRMELRVGIHVGDVLVEGDDLYGDGVNLAARLEPLAPAGGICLSASAHAYVDGKVGAEFVHLGERTVKNIARPVSVWCWSPRPLDDAPAATPAAARPRGRKPALAVGEFTATGAHADAAALAAGARDAMIVSLSNLTGLTLVDDASRADFVATATLQCTASRYRAIARLVDTRSGQQFWSDRFEDALDDLFDAQDQLAYRLSQAVRFSVYDREVAEMENTPVQERTLEMMLARAGQVIAGSRRGREWDECGPVLDSVLAANPGDAGAWAIKSCWHLDAVLHGWRDPSADDAAAARDAARQALRHNPNSDFAHMSMSLVLLYLDRDPRRAALEAERSLELSPYYAMGRFAQGLAWAFGGRPADAYRICVDTVRASPRIVMNHRILQAAAVGAWLDGRHEDALDCLRRSDHQVHDVAPTLMLLAAVHADAAQDADAATAAGRLLAMFPDFSLGAMRRWPFQADADLARFMAALARSGLPA